MRTICGYLRLLGSKVAQRAIKIMMILILTLKVVMIKEIIMIIIVMKMVAVKIMKFFMDLLTNRKLKINQNPKNSRSVQKRIDRIGLFAMRKHSPEILSKEYKSDKLLYVFFKGK